MGRERWVVLVLFTGCVQQVDLNPASDAGAAEGCPKAVETRLTCPNVESAATHAFSTTADVRSALIGRWGFCGGRRRATGRGSLTTFFGGAGIEIFEDADVLSFAYLKEQGSGYERRIDAWAFGTVRIETAGNVSTVVLVAVDGVETSWAVQRFDEPNVLRNITFDSWDFIPID